MKLGLGTAGRKLNPVGVMVKSSSNGWMEAVTDSEQWNQGCPAIAAVKSPAALGSRRNGTSASASFSSFEMMAGERHVLRVCLARNARKVAVFVKMCTVAVNIVS